MPTFKFKAQNGYDDSLFSWGFMEWVHRFPHLYNGVGKSPLSIVGLSERIYIKCLIWWMVHSRFPMKLYLCLLFIMFTIITMALEFQKQTQKGSDLPGVMQLLCSRVRTWTLVPQVLLGACARSAWTDSLGCLPCSSSGHKVLPQNCIWASPPLGDSVPFLGGSRILRLPPQ